MDIVFPVSSEVAGSPLPVTRHRKWVRQSSICRLSILRAYFGYVRQMQPDTDTWSERDLCSRSLSSIRERERASLKPDRDFTGLLHNPDSPSARAMLDVRMEDRRTHFLCLVTGSGASCSFRGYSTSPRNGNRVNGNHLEICLSSSQ